MATYGLSLGKLKRSYERAAANPDLAVEVQEAAALKATRTGRLLDWINARARAPSRRRARTAT